jgi:hypothetical protein
MGHEVVVADEDAVPTNAVEIPTPVTVAITRATESATVLRRCLDECMSFIRVKVPVAGYAEPSTNKRK